MSHIVLIREPRIHLIWFIHGTFPADLSKVREIFIDATFSVSKTNVHVYAIVCQELGHGVALGFMLVEVQPKENTTSTSHKGAALQWNHNFFSKAKELGLEPRFVHTDKDYAKISAAQVYSIHGMLWLKLCYSSWQVQDRRGSKSFE